MSRLWSRFGLRALAVALLVVGVIGGMYLGVDREAQQRGLDADVAAQADATELALMQQRQSEQTQATAQARAAAREAAAKAAEAAAAATERARKADQAVSRKKARTAKTPPTVASKPVGPIPKSCKEYSGNRAIGCTILLDETDFKLDQMPCLDKLWTKESHWRVNAHNKSSGAHGIPQAVPGRKMASEGADWEDGAATQIRWGLKYIEGRYGKPCDAWQHSQEKGWY